MRHIIRGEYLSPFSLYYPSCTTIVFTRQIDFKLKHHLNTSGITYLLQHFKSKVGVILHLSPLLFTLNTIKCVIQNSPVFSIKLKYDYVNVQKARITIVLTVGLHQYNTYQVVSYWLFKIKIELEKKTMHFAPVSLQQHKVIVVDYLNAKFLCKAMTLFHLLPALP